MKSEVDTAVMKRTVVGAGLLALDVLVQAESDTAEHHAAGGSFGNVMAILAWLGWRAVPFARLGEDNAADAVIADLSYRGVITDGIHRCSKSNTPIIVHRYGLGSPEHPRHRFEWVCPSCHRWLPRYVPIPKRNLPTADALDKAEICYIDRATPGTLALATLAKANGAIVIFEPPKLTDDPVASACLRICDILKYSLEYGGRRNSSSEVQPPLEIVSLGGDGLRYRLNGFLGMRQEWMSQEAPALEGSRDFAGCGDWLSAGFLHAIRCSSEVTLESVDGALKYGQALAAMNSLAVGARGLMALADRDKVTDMACAFSEGGRFQKPKLHTSQTSVMNWHRCVTCGGNQIEVKAPQMPR